MTDNLRDRIAATVARELLLQARDCGEYQTRDCYKVADAVIAALQGIVFDGDMVESPEWGGRHD